MISAAYLGNSRKWGIERVMRRLKGREKWMIPALMLLFAAGGTTYGMAEETLAFYVLLVPLMIAVGYDALTGVAVIMVGAGVGVIGSTINPFSTAIASNAALLAIDKHLHRGAAPEAAAAQLTVEA